MKKNITIIILLLAIIAGSYFLYTQKNAHVDNAGNITKEDDTVEKMDVTVYVNDEAASSEFLDCAINKKITVQVPKSDNVIDASLKYLFGTELSKYGTYHSVDIASGTAKVILESDLTPAGYPISGLSSCQSQNFTSVLKDTLIHDPDITTIKLYSPKGEIVF